jgi:hypothetical protein
VAADRVRRRTLRDNPGANNISDVDLLFAREPHARQHDGNLSLAYLVARPTDQDVLDTRQYIQRELKLFHAGEGVCLGDSTSAALLGQHSLGSLIYDATVDPLQSRVAMLAQPSDTPAGTAHEVEHRRARRAGPGSNGRSCSSGSTASSRARDATTVLGQINTW